MFLIGHRLASHINFSIFVFLNFIIPDTLCTSCELSALSAIDLSTLLERGPVQATSRSYIIHGWRWHTLSVMQDIAKFNKKLNFLSTSKLGTTPYIEKCFDFVFDFNLRTLLRVEKELFIPLFKKYFPKDPSITSIIREIEDHHISVHNYTLELGKLSKEYDATLQESVLNFIFVSVGNIYEILNHIAKLKLQDSVFIPLITAYVDIKDQEVFNKRVVKHLGLINAQTHLVSMYEAIKGNPEEEQLFRKHMPSIVMILMPVWYRTLYQPKKKFLETIGDL